MAEINLKIFEEMIRVTYNLYFWVLRADFSLEERNCPEPELLHELLMKYFNAQTVKETGIVPADPVQIITEFGTVWIADFETEKDQLKSICVIGPAFLNRSSADLVSEMLEKHGFPLQKKWALMKQLEHVPLVPMRRMSEYAKMLHIALTGNKTYVSWIQSIRKKSEETGRKDKLQDRDHDYEMEMILMKMIEDGNTSYWNARRSLSASFSDVSDQLKSPIRQTARSGIWNRYTSHLTQHRRFLTEQSAVWKSSGKMYADSGTVKSF